MKPTSDERRMVAESLRARSVGLALSFPNVRNSLNDMWVQRTLREIREAIGCECDTHPALWLMRLADLMDPGDAGPAGSQPGRCRDCEFFEPRDETRPSWCWRDPDHAGHGWPTSEGGFCSRFSATDGRN